MSAVVRTPEERFADLPDHPWQPRYETVTVGGLDLRLARVDEGTGHPVVLLHGEPTWSFLYRHVVPPLLDAGLRVVAPDHPGFGRSDKPTDTGWFTYDRLVAALEAHLAALGMLEPITLVVHDWGGPVGLRWAVDNPDRIDRLVILDTALYAPGGQPSETWTAFREFVEQTPDLPIGRLVDAGAAGELPAAVTAAYEAPFHTSAAKAGARALPLIVPLADDDPGAAEMWRVNQALDDWDRPTLLLWGAEDEVLPARIGRRWARQIPGSVGLETVAGAGHFLQEDAGGWIGARIASFATG